MPTTTHYLAPLTPGERYELATRLIRAMRLTSDEAGTMRHAPASVVATYSGAGLPVDWTGWDRMAADMQDVLCDDLLSAK